MPRILYRGRAARKRARQPKEGKTDKTNSESRPRGQKAEPEEPDPPLRSGHDMALRRAWMAGLPLGLVPDIEDDEPEEERAADRS